MGVYCESSAWGESQQFDLLLKTVRNNSQEGVRKGEDGQHCAPSKSVFWRVDRLFKQSATTASTTTEEHNRKKRAMDIRDQQGNKGDEAVVQEE